MHVRVCMCVCACACAAPLQVLGFAPVVVEDKALGPDDLVPVSHDSPAQARHALDVGRPVGRHDVGKAWVPPEKDPHLKRASDFVRERVRAPCV